MATDSIMAGGNERSVHDSREPCYGARLLPRVLDELALSDPTRIFASVPQSPDLSQGFREVTMEEMSHATSMSAWWLEERLGISQDFETMAYMGISDLRYTILFLAGVKKWVISTVSYRLLRSLKFFYHQYVTRHP